MNQLHTWKGSSLLHGGDYNPEQWLDQPDILKKDIEILKKTKCNTVTLGVFSWSVLEPEEGVFDFDWLARIMDELWENGIHTILATPSGARPKWLAQRYPEVLRTDALRRKQLFGFRHNHCLTSPVYREKTAGIDAELSRRFGSHPGLLLWHISNELGGECHCPLCQEAFRAYLKSRYADIDELNRKWWTRFWSHTYPDFDSIESPSPIGENQLHALNLEWRRFVTRQTASFIQNEAKAVRQYSDRPVTTNLMYYFDGLDYFKIADEVDLVSWDTYPTWHKDRLIDTARDNALWHDMMRSLKDGPFLLMESCPSSTNWQGVSKLKKPGVLKAQAVQAIAHGADGAMYFQVRQSRGGPEKFHGAIIDHYGGGDTRVIREVKAAGEILGRLAFLRGGRTYPQVAILYDWNSNWAMEGSQGPRNEGLHFKELLLDIYASCRQNALEVDLVDEDVSLKRLNACSLLIIPMGYMFREGFAEKARAFTARGGTLIVTFLSGIADETDLCFTGAVPHGLTDVLGIRRAETDGLYDWESNRMVPAVKCAITRSPEHDTDGFPKKEYACRYLCDLVEEDGAQSVLSYGDDFYAGTPALTKNCFGKGEAWYVAACPERALWKDLIRDICTRRGIKPLIGGDIPETLEVTSRVVTDGSGASQTYLIFQNFGDVPVRIPEQEVSFEDVVGSSRQPVPACGEVVVRLR